MRKAVFGLVLCLVLLLPFSSSAEDTGTCDLLETFAEEIMGARQAEVSMKKVVSALEDRTDPKNLRPLLKSLVIDAYEEPLWYADERKERAVKEFANKVYRECLKSRSSN